MDLYYIRILYYLPYLGAIPAMETTRLTRKGQVVIPKAIRDRLKVMPGTELSVTLEGGRIVLNPVRAKSQRLSAWPGFGRDVPALSDAQAFAPADLQDAP